MKKNRWILVIDGKTDNYLGIATRKECLKKAKENEEKGMRFDVQEIEDVDTGEKREI